MSNEKIIFFGDPHGHWEPLLEALEAQPRAVIVLGDLAEGKLDRHGTEKARSAFDAVIKRGIDLRFITGNHDNSTNDLWELVEEYDDHRIDGRVVEIGGLRIAGLGGVVRGKIWRGDGEAIVASEADLIARTPRQERWKGALPRKHLTTIMPWTVESLRQHSADVLVTHEAPSNHDRGFEFLDRLAADMKARLVVHGHHHRTYSGEISGGIQVQGVGLARVWELPTDLISKAG